MATPEEELQKKKRSPFAEPGPNKPGVAMESLVSELPVQPPKVQESNGARITQDGEDTLVDLNPQKTTAFKAPEMGADWHANLADQLSPQQRTSIADELLEYIDVDKQTREQHFRRMETGLELLGLKDMPESDTPFDGAASVTDPLIGEAIVQFSSRAIEEMFPASGPVKAAVLGEHTEEKQKQADRLEEYMNYQLTEEDEDYYDDVDQMLFYLPLSGSVFKKVYVDSISGMTTARYVSTEDFIIPYFAKNLRSAPRYAHRYNMHGNDIKRSQVSGRFYKHVRLLDGTIIKSDSSVSFSSDNLQDTADDRVPFTHEDDKEYELYETHIDYELPWTDPKAKQAISAGIAAPYRITIEKESREVLSVHRNWKDGDETFRKRIWFAHYKYLPGLGIYGFGLLHIIGSLAQAASGSIRAILDSAALANLPGGFKSKKARISGEQRWTFGEFRDVDMTPTDLQKAFLPLPVKEPSPALATTYQALIQRGKEFAGVTEVLTGDASNEGPVGTTLALIEQATKPQSAIHKRLHKAMRKELKMMGQINFEMMERDSYPYEVGGESREVLKKDFDGRVDIVPVSDPNIFSATQRIAVAQATLQLTTDHAALYGEKGQREAHKRMLAALKVPEPEKLLPEKKELNLDPVSENQNMITGKAVRAWYNQDHQAHMAVHQNFAQQMAASDPELFKQVEPVFIAHKMDHMAQHYRQEIEAQIGFPLPQFDLFDEGVNESIPPEIEQAISQLVASKLRPPPPPAQGPEEQREQAEAQQAQDQADAEAVAKLKRVAAEADQKRRNDQDAFDAEETRKTSAFKAEQKRKDEETSADVKREEKLAAAKRRLMVQKPTANSRGPVQKPKPKKTNGKSGGNS